MTLAEFSAQVRRVGSHPHKITGSWGVYDYFKFYRRTKPKEKKYILTESQYFAIIRKVNTILAESFVRGKEVHFPMRMGTIELRKTLKKPRLGPDGKVIFHTLIDWDKTIKLWYEDPEAYKNKTIIRQESREVFKTFYNKARATFENKSVYMFQLNKELKREISKNKRKGIIKDAFLLS